MKAINFIKQNIKKIFYCLLFIFLILLFLLWLPSLTEQTLSCKDFPGSASAYVFPNFVYQITDHIKSNEHIIGNIVLALTAILIIFSLVQKGVPRIIAIIFIIIFVLINIVSIDVSRPRAYDASRMAELSQVRAALEYYYFDNNEKYPGVPGSNQWNILGNVLVEKYLRQLPNDHCNRTNPEWTYEYWVSADGQKYVLKANLQSYSSTLNNKDRDLDGNIFGAFCGEDGPTEREYCVGNP